MAVLFSSVSLASLVFPSPAQAVLVWNFTYTAGNVDNGNLGTLNATLTTDGNTHSINTTYNIMSATGTAGSNSISLCPTGVAFPNSAYSADNQFSWNGTNGIILSFDGIAFEGPSGFVNNLFGSNLANFAPTVPSEFSATNVSLTPQAVGVPFESNSLPIIGSSLFFAGGVWLKRKRSQAKVSELLVTK